MKFKFIGSIRSQKKVKIGKDDCYGLTKANKNRFSIIISERNNGDFYQLSETLLHEFLHLFFFILSAFNKRALSESEQHKIMDKLTSMLLKKYHSLLRKKYGTY